MTDMQWGGHQRLPIILPKSWASISGFMPPPDWPSGEPPLPMPPRLLKSCISCMVSPIPPIFGMACGPCAGRWGGAYCGGAYCGGGGAYCRCGRGISSIFAMCSRSPGARKGSIAPRYSAARSRPCSLRMREAMVYAGGILRPLLPVPLRLRNGIVQRALHNMPPP